MKTDKLINAFECKKDRSTIISLKNPKSKYLLHFLNVFDEMLFEIGKEYKVECFLLSPRSKKNDIYHFKTNLPWNIFLEINK